MNKLFPLFLISLVFFSWSCEKEEAHDPVLVNGFQVNEESFSFVPMTSYKTEYGVLHAFEAAPGVNLWIVLSNEGADYYEFGAEVRASDTSIIDGTAKAYAVLEYDEYTYRSISGGLFLFNDDGVNEGSFEIQFPDGLSITNGSLRENNIAARPCKMFKDVLLTDENGLPLNNASNAWQTNEEWTSLEWSFFPSAYGNLISGEEIKMQGAFPNPFNDIFMLGLSADKTPDLYFVIVNDNFETILDYKNVFPMEAGQNALTLNANTMYGLTRDDTFRLYYIIQTEDGYIKGHGDIMRN
ncbi:MAG: hypothetical protein KDC24_07525 [Saprospiraceae bacterium]|nr:hypothetical protein [Saprospiraceae bacterium]